MQSDFRWAYQFLIENITLQMNNYLKQHMEWVQN